ncbi:hypothetical protein [Roseospira navarrensis]|uniref:Uncharacterized protein n=1 Tax=Roseospira navarrensis TaxID=140058 RepID=A0A7X1ZER5_9PROT|nr:hypothetical protein [Roseospira navarrensis]MQX36957.1 hypothetical protein [Roseospira navarrensis]
MLRFLIYFRYGMSFHGPRIGDHVESEARAFERVVAQRVLSIPTPMRPAS